MKIFRIICLLCLSSVSLYNHASTAIWFIHNAPDTAFASVSVSLESGGVLDTILFRQQKTFTIDSQYDGNVIIHSLLDTTQSFIHYVSWADSSSFIAIFSGIFNSGYDANPDGLSTNMTFESIDESILQTPSSGQTAILFSHGGTDFPTTDITQYPGTLSVDGLAYGETEDILRESIGYNFNMLTSDSSLLMATFRTDFSNYSSKRVVLLLSGFLRPSANKNGKYFGVYLASRDSLNFIASRNVTLVRQNSKISFQVFPNPSVDIIHVSSPNSLRGKILSIISTEGKIVEQKLLQSTDNNFSMPVYHLPKGMYWIRIDQTATPIIIE